MIDTRMLDASNDDFMMMPSGIYIHNDTAEDYFNSLRRPKAIDLFAGAGGMSLGLIQGGFEVVAAVDNWPMAAITYLYNLGSYPCNFHFVDDSDHEALEKELIRNFKRKNTPVSVPVSGSGWISHQPGVPGVGHFWLGDIRKITGRQILKALGMKRGEIDCVAGGPPCQGFSVAGRRNVMDPRNSLVFEFARLVCEIQPKTMVMENVPGIINMVTPQGVPVVDALTRILEDGGFGGADAFMNSIEAQTGNVGLLRGKQRSMKSSARAKTDDDTTPKQIEFAF